MDQHDSKDIFECQTLSRTLTLTKQNLPYFLYRFFGILTLSIYTNLQQKYFIYIIKNNKLSLKYISNCMTKTYKYRHY